MKRINLLARMMRRASLLSLILFACFAAARAQTVIPRVCVKKGLQTGTATLTTNVSGPEQGAYSFDINSSVPLRGFMRMVINPGGANEEHIIVESDNGFTMRGRTSNYGGVYLIKAHSAGEPVQWSADAEAFFGYNNTSSATINVPRGTTAGNFFAPGPVVYSTQPSVFLPGIHENVFSRKIVSGLQDITWFLNGSQATFGANTGPGCATITYQGRLSEQGAAANGQYDLRFTVFDALTGGTAQSESLVVENVQVANGVFTVQLNFGSSFANNNNAKFLEIAVRPGAASGEDPFTLLTPRQPITAVPFAINTGFAQNAANATNAAQLGGITADKYITSINGSTTIGGNTQINGDGGISKNLIVTGNGTIGGNLTVSGTITSANFNISGNGTIGETLSANTINSATQYNIGGNRVLSTAGTNNLFAGARAGEANLAGNNNAFVGYAAGLDTTTGNGNVFVGANTASRNTTGSNNTIIGHNAQLAANNLNFATALGSGAIVNASNTVVLGRSADTVQVPGTLSANAVNSRTQYNIGGNRVLSVAGTNNVSVGLSAGTTGSQNTFVGQGAGASNTTGVDNLFVGFNAGQTNKAGNANTVIGVNADVGGDNLNFATAIGAGASVSTSNTIVLGRANGGDHVRIAGLGAAGSTQLCRNADNEIATCSSSLRYKTNIAPFRFGLSFINQLRPITFDWKTGGMSDVGFSAEDVARINPLFVFYNSKGEVEGVKYDRLSVLFVNAFKEQQTQIEAQQKQLEE